MFDCLKKVLYYKDVKYKCLLEKDVNFKINSFLSKQASSMQPAAHNLPMSKPCKITDAHLIEIKGPLIRHFSY